MEPILTIDNLNSFGGNMLRQGDKSQLKYRLRDVGNKNLGISSKSCEVKMYGRNYTTVVYETTTTVSSENTVSFTIDKVLPKGTFYLEFTVGDYIFPTDHREFFEITPSGKGMEANIIEIVGKDVLIQAVKSQVDAELQPLVTSLESAEQAEAQRATAESSRVSAETQRKIDHANRSAEFDGKADKVVLKNFISTDLTYSRLGVTYTVSDGVIDATVDESSGTLRGLFLSLGDTVEGHLYFLSVDGMFSKEVRTSIGNYNDRKSIDITKLNTWETIMLTSRRGAQATFTWYFNMGITQPGDGFKLRNLMLIDLTETFGEGNEPTQEEMAELIKVTGYIDGEYTLNNKEMLSGLMKVIHEKANKKQEDWITPTLLNGWVNFDASRAAKYMVDDFGFVHLKGVVKSGSGIIFILPSGYRPTSICYIASVSNSEYAYVNISTVGHVKMEAGTNAWLSLENITFKIN